MQANPNNDDAYDSDDAFLEEACPGLYNGEQGSSGTGSIGGDLSISMEWDDNSNVDGLRSPSVPPDDPPAASSQIALDRDAVGTGMTCNTANGPSAGMVSEVQTLRGSSAPIVGGNYNFGQGLNGQQTMMEVSPRGSTTAHTERYAVRGNDGPPPPSFLFSSSPFPHGQLPVSHGPGCNFWTHAPDNIHFLHWIGAHAGGQLPPQLVNNTHNWWQSNWPTCAAGHPSSFQYPPPCNQGADPTFAASAQASPVPQMFFSYSSTTNSDKDSKVNELVAMGSAANCAYFKEKVDELRTLGVGANISDPGIKRGPYQREFGKLGDALLHQAFKETFKSIGYPGLSSLAKLDCWLEKCRNLGLVVICGKLQKKKEPTLTLRVLVDLRVATSSRDLKNRVRSKLNEKLRTAEKDMAKPRKEPVPMITDDEGANPDAQSREVESILGSLGAITSQSENHKTDLSKFFIKKVNDVLSRVQQELRGATHQREVQVNNRSTLIHLIGMMWCLLAIAEAHNGVGPKELSDELQGMQQGGTLDNEMKLCYAQCTIWQTDVRGRAYPITFSDSARELREMFIGLKPLFYSEPTTPIHRRCCRLLRQAIEATLQEFNDKLHPLPFYKKE